MSKKLLAVVGIVIAIIAVFVVTSLFNSNSNQNSTKSKSLTTEQVASASTGFYTDYSTTNLAANPDGINIIFFHAPWCPVCRAAEKDINANLDKIPKKFQILKTDYDTSAELKKKYGVTTQSTYVKVDKDGNKLAMMNDFNGDQVNSGISPFQKIINFGNK